MAVCEASSQANIVLSPNDFRIEWFSGTGKGGQHRNKRQNSCRVIHLLTGYSESRQGRSREQNKRDAISGLLLRLNDNAAKDAEYVLNTVRHQQIGSGYRGEKIRTYRQRDNSVVDHRSGKRSSYVDVLKGRFEMLWK